MRGGDAQGGRQGGRARTGGAEGPGEEDCEHPAALPGFELLLRGDAMRRAAALERRMLGMGG